MQAACPPIRSASAVRRRHAIRHAASHSIRQAACHSVCGSAVLLLSGLLIAVLPSTVAMAQSLPVTRPVASDPYAAPVNEAAQRFHLPAAWIRAVMRVESRNDRDAISPKGAMGVMQIMPATWSELRRRHALGADPFDPSDNILAGAAYLRELHDRYGSPGFLAAYNAGPGRYEQFLGGRPLPAETRAYVAALLPFIRGEDHGAKISSGAAARRPWTYAPLFVAPPERVSVTYPAVRNPHPVPQKLDRESEPATAISRAVSAMTPQSRDLFIAHTRFGEPQ